jgi:hypothetical protein
MKKHGSYKAELNGLPASFDQLAFFKGPRWAVFARAPIELTDSHFCVVETLASTSLGKKINDLRIYGGVPPRRATTYHKTYTVRALEDIPLQYSGEKDTLHENELLTVEMVEEPIRIVTTRRHLLPKHY